MLKFSCCMLENFGKSLVILCHGIIPCTYQTDKPMLPFLCADLYKMVKALMDRFVKDDVMSRVSSVQQLQKIDVGLKENHKVYSKIDIGFMAEKSSKSAVDQKTKKKISDKELMQFSNGM